MEQIFFVKNGNLERINEFLKQGWHVKSIHAVSESVSAYGYSSDFVAEAKGSYVGDIFAYIVLER